MTNHRVYVDTDGGLDDVLALAFLLRHPETEVTGIGTVHGNVPATAAARNSLRLLELVAPGAAAIPVAVGAAAPLRCEVHYRHPEDPAAALLGTPTREPVDVPAHEQLLRLARDADGELELLMLGPLTNLALALQKEPNLPALVRSVTVMGGAFDVEGNISPHAESNIWHDPDAADIVLTAGFADLTLVGLDVTREVQPTTAWLEALAEDTLPWGAAARALAGLPADQRPPLPLHDPLAAAVMLNPDLVDTTMTGVRVEVTTGERRGATDLAELGTGHGVRVATSVARDTALAALLTGLRPRSQSRGRRSAIQAS